MEFRPLTPAIGSEVMHLDLAEKISDTQVKLFRKALCERGVLFIRDQSLSAQQLLDFASKIGQPIESPHPKFGCVDGLSTVSLVINDRENPPDINVWHSDLSFHEKPAGVCTLYCQECPEVGGDTIWSSMVAAYEALEPDLKSLAHRLQIRHQLPLDGYPRDLVLKAVEKPISSVHPMVRKIPETDALALYVNRVYAQSIVGMEKEQARDLLKVFVEHAERPDFQVRFKWQPGSVAIWDNRLTQHYAVADYYPQRRVMHRVACAGEVVIAPDG